MRMWMVAPEKMCRNHLMGEHVEIHMLLGSIRLGKSIEGFIRRKLVEPASITLRHDALVAEMVRRGYKHGSPIGDDCDALLSSLPKRYLRAGIVNVETSEAELRARCADCKKLLEGDTLCRTK